MDFFDKIIHTLQNISGSTALLLFFASIFICFTVVYLLTACLQTIKLCKQTDETRHTFSEDLHIDSFNMTSVNAYLNEQNRLNEEEMKKIKPWKTVDIGKNFTIKIGEEKTAFSATFPGFKKIAVHSTEIAIYFLTVIGGVAQEVTNFQRIFETFEHPHLPEEVWLQASVNNYVFVIQPRYANRADGSIGKFTNCLFGTCYYPNSASGPESVAENKKKKFSSSNSVTLRSQTLFALVDLVPSILLEIKQKVSLHPTNNKTHIKNCKTCASTNMALGFVKMINLYDHAKSVVVTRENGSREFLDGTKIQDPSQLETGYTLTQLHSLVDPHLRLLASNKCYGITSLVFNGIQPFESSSKVTI